MVDGSVIPKHINMKEDWLIVGTETKKIHARFRSRASAITNKSRIEFIYLEKCKIVYKGVEDD